MHKIIPGIIFSLVMACRMAAGGEGVFPSGNGDFNIWRLLDYGALGAFTVFLILDRRHRDKKDLETAQRFQDLDKEIVALTKDGITVSKDATVTMSIMTSAANELRASVNELKNVLYTKPCLRPPGSRTRDADRHP